MVKSCTKFSEVKDGDNCGTIAKDNNISLSTLNKWNPVTADSKCTQLQVGENLCFSSKEIGAAPIQTSKPSPTQDTLDPESTKGPNGISTPLPYNPHMVTNCARFYKVRDGDDCVTIGSKNGLSLNNICK
jgi:hypothetical protein